MDFRQQTWLTKLLWALLVLAGLVALANANWSLAFVAAATLLVSLFPTLFIERFQIRLPQSFITVIVAFVFATLFLGESFDFYERYWWWDIVLHGASAIGFGLLGFLFVFMLFEGDRFAAPPFPLAFFGFCFAVAIGATWEVFEFSMDQLFGFNMQKSGLVDTMADLIVNLIGSAIGALAGYLFLKKVWFFGLATMIRQFIRENRHVYRKDED